MLNRKPEKLLPHSETSNELANKFADFFAEKITRIRNNIMDMNSSVIIETPLSATMLSVFEQTNPDELSTLIQASACKSSDLDPLPGAVMKDCFHVLLPVITRIVNLSMTTWTVPIAMKEASLSPLLKRPSLDHEQIPNFRPISNLPFISKCTEKVVASRLTPHVNNNNLSEIFQSAYERGHSTETALVRVQNDIPRAIDNGDCVILLLLDLSAAFDTVDHIYCCLDSEIDSELKGQL